MEKHVHSSLDAIQEFVQQYATKIAGIDIATGNPGLLPSYRDTDRDNTLTVATYIVEASIPTTGVYIVRKPGTNVQHVCSQMYSSGGFMAASDMPSIPIGSQVIVAAAGNSGVILGEKPYQLIDKRTSYMDFISTGCGFNFYVSPIYSIYYTKLADGKKLPINKPNTLYDAMSGDKTVSTPTGVMSHVDADMAFLRTSEICGAFFFRESGHARISGERLDLESMCVRQTTGLENGETFSFNQTFMYPWEIVGAKEPSAVDVVTFSSDAIKDGTLNYGEPAESNAIPISRITEIGGFAGQGQQIVVAAPQWSKTESTVQTSDLPVAEEGLLRTYLGKDGTYMVESTRQLLFVKAAGLLSPRFKSDPGEYNDGYVPNGDAENYPPNENVFKDSSYGSILPHEHYANVSGWQSMIGVVGRDDVALVAPSKSDNPIEYSTDGTDEISQASSVDVDVDDNFKQISISQILSMFGILPNGDVVIRNGLGAEIKLSKGSITLSGVGVHVNAGKTVSVMGNRLSLRAHKDAELSSANSSVRIKAEKDVVVLAANGGTGSFLVDHRGYNNAVELSDDPAEAAFSGIVLKSPSGHVSLVAGDIVAKTGPTSGGVKEGKIILDAGRNEILQRARVHRRYATSSFHDHFGDSNEVRRTNSYFSNGTLLTGSLTTLSTIVSGGSIQATKGMYTVNGPFATGEERYTERVFLNPRPDIITDYISQSYSNMEQNGTLGFESLQDFVSNFETQDRPLNPISIRRTAFGFLSSQSYDAAQQSIKQPYWQQLPIQGSQTWREPEVKYPTGNSTTVSEEVATMPWPGKDSWRRPSMQVAKNPFRLVDITSHQITDPKAEPEKYRDASADEYGIDFLPPDENFKVID
jgi:hypothetical protein